jgi:hypothetical protein
VTHEFSTLNEAARALLVETCALLNERDVDYVIAGGWVPMLRGDAPNIQHPGTRDVDVLFNDNRQAIRNAVQIMLQNGFVLSAKHEFQLLRTLRVASREFVFNVDLMHPLEASANCEMFEDILDLGISSDYDENRPKVKSICFPSSAIIFEHAREPFRKSHSEQVGPTHSGVSSGRRTIGTSAEVPNHQGANF